MVFALYSLLLGSPVVQAEPPTVVNVGSGFMSVYAVDGGDGVVLVDAHNPGQEHRIVERMERAGIDPDRVTLLLLTHVHPDHAGSAAALGELLDVPVALGADDAALAAAGEMAGFPQTGGRGRLFEPLVRNTFPAFVPDITIDETLDLRPYGVRGQAKVVGGHTGGSLVVELEDGPLLSGDLIRSRIGRRHQPTLHFFHEDGVEAHAQLAELVADPAVEVVLPGHGKELDADDVRDWLESKAPRHAERLEALAVR